ncbi:hypothetical protein [Nostoc sp.]|uniref:hypothetical protein n=1 Tax=Nostoc sp. TaxID=1180 RepID=UPI002FF9E387
MQNTESSTTSTIWASSADVNNDLAEANVIVSKLSDEALLKMEVIQSLLENSDRTTNSVYFLNVVSMGQLGLTAALPD